MDDAITILLESQPAHSHEIQEIRRIGVLVDSFEAVPFIEPLTVIAKQGETGFALVTPELIAAWVNHLSYGTRYRMRGLENAVLSELANRRLNPAIALARSHMEVAAAAAFALRAITDFADTGDDTELGRVIYRMLYGTSLTKGPQGWRSRPSDLEPTRPIQSSKLINSLSDLAGTCGLPGPDGVILLYAALCDHAHPNFEGGRAFATVKQVADGWTYVYGPAERLDFDDLALVLRSLLLGMRLGHMASLFILQGEVVDHGSHVTFEKPDSEIGRLIWDQLISSPRTGSADQETP